VNLHRNHQLLRIPAASGINVVAVVIDVFVSLLLTLQFLGFCCCWCLWKRSFWAFAAVGVSGNPLLLESLLLIVSLMLMVLLLTTLFSGGLTAFGIKVVAAFTTVAGVIAFDGNPSVENVMY
jgi:hypothetical protein